MKIKDLDRNEVYSLEEIKKDSVKFDMLKEWLRDNDKNYNNIGKLLINTSRYVRLSKKTGTYVYGNLATVTKCALTLFELDITDYQVDCTDLSKEQIEEMAEVVKGRGFNIWSNKEALSLTDFYRYFKYNDDEGFFIVCIKVDSKTTITYDKFMELFGEKVQWIQSDFGQYKLTEQGIVFHDDFDLELYKESCGLSNKPIEQAAEELSEAFEQKPSQYQIGIDTFTRAEANMTREEILACVRFNLDKYTWRKKGQDKEDFEKIIAYANWGLKHV